MKLDVNVLRYLSKDEFRVLTAVEMGMKNHEIVPTELVERIAGLKHGGAFKNVKTLLKHKLVHHDSSKYDGYRLTTLGYDFLAIKTMVNRGLIVGVGRQIGVGKESDIFEVVAEDGRTLALKLHRLGRTSFRAVKSKRDYLKHRNSFNWLYLSRLAALKEYAFMKALGEHGFPVPNAVDWNRHCVLMTLVPGYPLVQVKELENPGLVFETVISLIIRLAESGLIHCDFNEFNILIDDEETVTMIDFPQMVSVSHRNAEMYFNRDVECIFKFFNKRFSFCPTFGDEKQSSVLGNGPLDPSGRPRFKALANMSGSLDKELAASGFTHQDQEDLEQYSCANVGEDEGFDEDELSDKATSSEEDVDQVTRQLDDAHILDSELQTSEGAVNDCNEQLFQSHDEGGDGICQSSFETESATTSTKGETLALKGLVKQRKHAVAALRGGRVTHPSRNASKDKGGRRSRHGVMNSKLDF